MHAPMLATLAVLLVSPLVAQTRPGPAPARVGFTTSLAVSADEILAGRSGSPFTPAGAVHVFRQGADGTWRETTTVQGNGTRPADGFARALAVDGDLMAVGAPRHGEGGAVFLFTRRDGS